MTSRPDGRYANGRAADECRAPVRRPSSPWISCSFPLKDPWKNAGTLAGRCFLQLGFGIDHRARRREDELGRLLEQLRAEPGVEAARALLDLLARGARTNGRPDRPHPRLAEEARRLLFTAQPCCRHLAGQIDLHYASSCKGRRLSAADKITPRATPPRRARRVSAPFVWKSGLIPDPALRLCAPRLRGFGGGCAGST